MSRAAQITAAALVTLAGLAIDLAVALVLAPKYGVPLVPVVVAVVAINAGLVPVNIELARRWSVRAAWRRARRQAG